MATMTFLSSTEAEKYMTNRPTPLKVPTKQEIFYQELPPDACEFSFIEAAPVSVSTIPEECGLTLKDIFVDEISEDDDIEVIEEIPTISGLSVIDYGKIKKSVASDCKNTGKDVDMYYKITKDNPHVTISRATFDQVISIKPAKKLELKPTVATLLWDDIHKNSNLQASVVINKLTMQQCQQYHQTANKYEMKIEQEEFSHEAFGYDSISDNQVFTASSDDESFEGFSADEDISSRKSFQLRSIIEQLRREREEFLLEVREFSLEGMIPGDPSHDVTNIKRTSKTGKFSRSTNNLNMFSPNGYRKNKNGSAGDKLSQKKFRCSHCDYSVEDFNILQQHYIIHKIYLGAMNNEKVNVPKSNAATCNSRKNQGSPNIRRQLRSHKLTKLSCEICQSTFKYPKIFQKHYIYKHHIYKCAFCSIPVTSKRSLSKHLFNEHLLKMKF